MDMMACHRWPALTLCGVACFAACSPASDRRSDDGEPDTLVAQAAEGAGPALPFVVDNVCPGEGCVFGTWLACGPVPGYAEAGDRATEVFRLSRDESFTVRTGQMWVAVPGLVVVREAIPNSSRQVEPTVFAAGDTVYVLHYVGEGFYNVWYQGVEVEAEAFWTEAVGAAEPTARGMLLRERTTEYWVEAETAVGQRGWVLVETGLVLAANGRDPEPLRCRTD